MNVMLQACRLCAGSISAVMRVSTSSCASTDVFEKKDVRLGFFVSMCFLYCFQGIIVWSFNSLAHQVPNTARPHRTGIGLE